MRIFVIYENMAVMYDKLTYFVYCITEIMFTVIIIYVLASYLMLLQM